MKDLSKHKTTTGKEFILTDLKGNPLEYDSYKENFTRNHLAMLEVGQSICFKKLGVLLKRTK